MLLLITVAGCAEMRGGGGRFEPIAVPSDTALPRAIVYGSFMERLPRYDVTPALEMFLYGPNDVGKTALRNPQGMALAGGRLLVCDQGQPDVVAIDLATGRSRPLTDASHRPRCPVAVAADDTRVYVADPKSWCVAVYDHAGKLLDQLSPTAEPDRKFQPASVLVHDGILYIGNVGEHRIDRYCLAERAWTMPLTPPADADRLIAPTGLAMTAGGTLLVVDAVQCRVRPVAADGTWSAPIGRPGRGPGEFVRPKQVALTPAGRIAVVDAGRQSLLIFKADGKFLMEVFGTDGRWPGFTLPAAVVALPADRLPAEPEMSKTNAPPADEYLIVSDSLGGMPLTLIGMVHGEAEGGAHAK